MGHSPGSSPNLWDIVIVVIVIVIVIVDATNGDSKGSTSTFYCRYNDFVIG
jgi:hypothetical protein